VTVRVTSTATVARIFDRAFTKVVPTNPLSGMKEYIPPPSTAI
jgi:hypothetical protein